MTAILTILVSSAAAFSGTLVLRPSLPGGCCLSSGRHHAPRRSRLSTLVLAAAVDSDIGKVDKGFRLLELASGIVPQGIIVQTVSESWTFVWKRMMAELAPQDKSGSYQRPAYTFSSESAKDKRTSVLADEVGRYHLYVGNPCPWCHRTLLASKILGITTEQLGVTRLEDNPRKASRGGWIFSSKEPDTEFGCRDLRELYDRLSPGFTGRCTAPLLVDKNAGTIVSNESSDIVRILNRATFGKSMETGRLDLYPADLALEIGKTNEWIYRLLNNGVYRCGFSTSQSAYNAAALDVREGLQRCEDIFSKSPYLCGSLFTEADLRLLPTALRFDGAYAPLFKAGGSHLRLKDYPYLHNWMRRCWKIPGVPDSIDLADACSSYYRQLFPLNPGGIVPLPVSPEALGLV
jgi:glutathionyl-hydroquinone reductase